MPGQIRLISNSEFFQPMNYTRHTKSNSFFTVTHQVMLLTALKISIYEHQSTISAWFKLVCMLWHWWRDGMLIKFQHIGSFSTATTHSNSTLLYVAITIAIAIAKTKWRVSVRGSARALPLLWPYFLQRKAATSNTTFYQTHWSMVTTSLQPNINTGSQLARNWPSQGGEKASSFDADVDMDDVARYASFQRWRITIP